MPKGDATYPAMTIDECLAFADEWSRGMTYHTGSQGWRVVCMLLAEEVREMRAELDEQCRLLGMGASREARLMAQLAESQARELRLREAIAEAHDCSLDDDHRAGRLIATTALAMPADDSALRAMIEAAKAEEREACVRVCEELYQGGNAPEDAGVGRCVEEIRARGGK